MNTYELVNALKARYGLKSDYETAKFLNIDKQSVYNWRDGKECSDKVALILAEKLGYNPARVLLEVQASRSESPLTKKAFLEAAKALPLEIDNKNNGIKEAS